MIIRSLWRFWWLLQLFTNIVYIVVCEEIELNGDDSFVSLSDDDDDISVTSKDYNLKLLSKQVRALVERRTEDLKSIEENVRKIVFNGPEVTELREQVRTLKQEIEQLRSHTTNDDDNASTFSITSKNDQLTVKWLANTMMEMKTEIGELQNVLNGSIILQHREKTETEMNLLKSDMLNYNEEMETMRMKNAKYEAEMSILKEEFNVLKKDFINTSAANGELKNQLKSLQIEWKRYQNQVLPPFFPLENITQSRHQHILRRHVFRMEKTIKFLHKENHFLKNNLSKLENEIETIKGTKSISKNPNQYFDRINGNEIQNYIETNRLQVEEEKEKNHKIENDNQQWKKLIKQQLINIENIANLSKQMTNFDKLHFSMLELLENVESIESKVDKSVPEFRKEISKIENQLGASISDISLLKEDYKNMRDSMKAISFSVSKLQEQNGEWKEKWQQFQQHLNILETSDVIQNTKLHNHILKEESSINLNATKSTIHLVEELQSFESEYKSIVNKLPRHCGTVDGPKGIYLISPSDGEPILAQCQDGWTTIQKRYDGSIDFNRNWNEYSNGFGSATGEHWLGNRNLYHLTKDNCTQLQINMKDIYGKYWQAEYHHFHVADYTEGFRMIVTNYHGNASDAMDYQNKMEFSTIDNDRDISNNHCASDYEGGWWFSHCQHANLNGNFKFGFTWFDSTRNEWIAVAESEMRVKRNDVC